MANDRAQLALERINQNLDRIENAAAHLKGNGRGSVDMSHLAARHDVLRREAEEALAGIDAALQALKQEA